MKKRLLTILICAALTVQYSACGISGNAETSQAPETAETTPQNDHSGIYGTAGEVSAYDTENSNYSLTVNAGDPVHEISDTLFGIFIEDINFAAAGGLYAEMVQNRSFEFTKLASGNERHAWSDVGSITANVRSEGGLNENNPNYICRWRTAPAKEPASRTKASWTEWRSPRARLTTFPPISEGPTDIPAGCTSL